MELYVIQPKKNKHIKVVIKGLPHYTKSQDIVTDLEELGYTVTSCNQLISKRTKLELLFFLVIMPRNSQNPTIFDLSSLGYMEIKVEGYSIRGITQCYRCNNFFQTTANCYMDLRYLKCGKDHPTKDCDIKERQGNPYCINCEVYGHTACYTKCPRFPKPKNGTHISNRNNRNFTSDNIIEGISLPIWSLEKLKAKPPPPSNNNNKSEGQSTIQISPLMKIAPLTSKT
ncbi:nucleic-acid-binding protein from transposon X-element [Trichonephila clavipes]|nr:nucleic-acid-binding protein from transposon X-element [Trichonephila clavipes]